MGERAALHSVERPDPELLGFLASARDAPLGELEFDVLAWLITHWFKVGRPSSGRLSATFGDLARSLYGRKGGGTQYELIRNALDNLYAVSLDLVLVKDGPDGPALKGSRRKRIIQTLEVRDPDASALPSAGGGVEVELATWLVQQLDARTITALSWSVIRKLSGVSKRLAVYLAAHDADFSPITRHTERYTAELDDALYEELGVTASRDRQRRATVARALARIAKHDGRYSSLSVEPAGGSFVLRAERPIEGVLLPLPTAE